MAIVVRYRVAGPYVPHKRYVGRHPEGGYRYCITNRTLLDIEQGRCDADDLPEAIRAACDSAAPSYFYVCQWPMDG